MYVITEDRNVQECKDRSKRPRPLSTIDLNLNLQPNLDLWGGLWTDVDKLPQLPQNLDLDLWGGLWTDVDKLPQRSFL